MPRKIQSGAPHPARHTLAVMGDSVTFNYNYGVLPHLLWPELLAAKLRALGCSIQARNHALAGDTTQAISTPPAPGMLGRLFLMTQWECPDIAVLYAGVNDMNANTPTITATQTTANLNAMIVQLAAAGCSRVVVVKEHYMNFSGAFAASRDTGSGVSIVQGTYSDARARQAAVSAQGGVTPVIADAMTYLSTLIGSSITVGGMQYTVAAGADVTPPVGGGFNWHVADGNLHLNGLGQELVARCVLAAIQAQPGWVAAVGG